MKTPILLVSQSPRRQEILKNLGIDFKVALSPFEEIPQIGLSPFDQTRYLSESKARAYIEQNSLTSLPVLSGDTLLDHEGEALGKPRDIGEAESFLRRLSGKTHRVLTSLTLYIPPALGREGFYDTRTEETLVTFYRLDESLIEFYLGTGDWQDAAGGYKIQKAGELLIERMEGPFSNVVGLPIKLFYDMMSQIMPSLGR